MAPGFLISITVVEYLIHQAVRRYFSLKQLRLSLIMEVLVIRKKKGGQKQTGMAFQPTRLLIVTFMGVTLDQIFAFPVYIEICSIKDSHLLGE